MTTTLAISGLSSLDQEELQEALPEDVEFDEPDVPEGALAEPATITAIITLGSGALGVLAVWLSKRRRSYLWQETVKIQHPDGRVEERTLAIRASSEDEAKVEALKQLRHMFPASLVDAAPGGGQ